MGQLFSRHPTPTRHRKSGKTSTTNYTRGYAGLDSSVTRNINQDKFTRKERSSRTRSGPQSEQQQQGASTRSSRRTTRVPHEEGKIVKSKVSGQRKPKVPRTHDSNPSRRLSHTIETKECLICTNTRSLHRFPTRPPTSQCNHAPDVCLHCLRTWLGTEFSTKLWSDLSCPVCAAHLSYYDVRSFAPRDVYRRYKALTLSHALEAIPNFHWCPFPRCKAGQIQACATPRFKCASCKRVSCLEHGRPWHKGETCAQYDYRTDGKQKKAEEAASKELMGRTTKTCPGCARRVEKTYGCDHMTCSKCKHEYCWQCLAPYGKLARGRVKHRPGCGHYDPAQNPR